MDTAHLVSMQGLWGRRSAPAFPEVQTEARARKVRPTRSASVRSRVLLAILAAVAAAPLAAAQRPPHTFAVAGDHFELDGTPLVIRSGEMHYPRVPREYWRDRMRKARAMGLNAVCTYVFWNAHERREGTFDFTGNLDVAAFVRTAREEGLLVILRPGPYVCSEWDLGGLPSWLLAAPDMRLRSADPRFLVAARRYLDRVGRELAPLQITRGGPIALVQVENEYGSFGADKAYLGAIRDAIRAAGFEVPLFTSDGPDDRLLAGGTLPDVLSAINFGDGDDPAEQLATFARFRTGVPRMVGELWAGWFDHWGRPHHTTPPADSARAVEWLLAHGVSFNLYMFHGGTTFGLAAGANSTPGYRPDTSSYDYDAPLDEAGRPTAKFAALREVIARHLPADEALPALPPPLPVAPLPEIALAESAPLAQALGAKVRAESPLSFEALGLDRGLVVYRTRVTAAADVLEVVEAHDWALVMQGGRTLGALDRRLDQCCLDVQLAGDEPLEIVVDAMGRINFGPHLLDDRKGITGKVLLGGRELKGWEMFPLPLEALPALHFAPGDAKGPAFHRGSFAVTAPTDTFIDMRGWGRGIVWVDGHNLGRFWGIGPQQTLFCPAPWLRPGVNEIVVLELDDRGARTVRGLVDPVFELRTAR
jgi:beta-galactosidase